MNKKEVSRCATIRRIRRALKHWDWYLVIARGADSKVERDLGRYYLVDGSGDLKKHHCDLSSLARDLMVLDKRERMEGYDASPEDAGQTIAVEKPTNRLTAEVMEILAATLGPVVIESSSRPEEIPQTSLIDPLPEVEEWEGLVDEDGRLWVSWPKRKIVDHQ